MRRNKFFLQHLALHAGKVEEKEGLSPFTYWMSDFYDS